MTERMKVQAGSTSSDDAQSVVRVLRWYEKNGDRLVGEAVLNTVKLPELQMLFHEPLNNLMVDSYPVSMSQVDQLQSAIAQPINLNAYDYYIECDAV